VTALQQAEALDEKKNPGADSDGAIEDEAAWIRGAQ
jgi:hypothetical protein